MTVGLHPVAGGNRCALPNTPLAAASAGLDACVHCGFCLQACPTYVNLEDENDSPRGRLVIMRRMLEGELALSDPDAGRHLDRCLGCRACETACPSGVPYGELLEATRATMAPVRGVPFIARVVLAVFARRSLLRTALFAARALRATPLPGFFARVLPPRLAFPFAMLASTVSALGTPSGRKQPSRSPNTSAVPASAVPASAAPASASSNATLLTGCVMHGLFGHVNDATARVLAENGHTVVETAGQHCCGALHAHAGDLEGARRLARLNIVAFEAAAQQQGVAKIAINSAGCGAMVKGYAHLLHDDAEWSARAARVSAMAADISELLVEAGPRPGGVLALRVTNDPPCHQMHAQRIVRQPVAVLNAVPGLDLVPLEDADQCCGSAGIYNLVEPDTSDAVLAPKIACIAETRAAYVATGNPGCMMQIGAGLLRSGSTARVVHPVELLDASYRAEHAGTA
ncbi:MAG TPA: heterodisulfide reductase-related iron-sulfur binding cluster [Gemmatimonas sp.]|nr:heterodisulfide reductase-related iron-sulfur binding cluster [Gemmatimonas sp.]